MSHCQQLLGRGDRKTPWTGHQVTPFTLALALSRASKHPNVCLRSGVKKLRNLGGNHRKTCQLQIDDSKPLPPSDRWPEPRSKSSKRAGRERFHHKKDNMSSAGRPSSWIEPTNDRTERVANAPCLLVAFPDAALALARDHQHKKPKKINVRSERISVNPSVLSPESTGNLVSTE